MSVLQTVETWVVEKARTGHRMGVNRHYGGPGKASREWEGSGAHIAPHVDHDARGGVRERMSAAVRRYSSVA